MAVASFAYLIILTLIIGFSIFLSLPIIYARNLSGRSIMVLTSFAIGILIFILADIFGDVSSQIYSQGSYVANIVPSALFVICAGGAFFLLHTLQTRRKSFGGDDPMHISVIVAVAIGFQNLTEGLVFGSTWSVGLTGLLTVIFVGFVLQNFTEGFPIVSPFLGSEKPKVSVVSLLFLIGAIPTITGSIVGNFYTNQYLNTVFDSLAIGSILYIILPMLQTVFKNSGNGKSLGLAYSGLAVGFIIGFLVNII